MTTTSRTETPDSAITSLAHDWLARDPFLPTDARVYLRRGRRFTRAFWAHAGHDTGSILFFVERAGGRVFLPTSSTKPGRANGERVSS